jgi:hypothetical protein
MATIAETWGSDTAGLVWRRKARREPDAIVFPTGAGDTAEYSFAACDCVLGMLRALA